MPMPQQPVRRLPKNPSAEHLRKLAKRLAKSEDLRLAAAQRRLAVEYGQRSWAALMRLVDEGPRAVTESGLSAAAGRADADAVREALARGEPANGRNDKINTPLWHACASEAPDARRIAVVRLLLDAGASPRETSAGQVTALHA